jgi:hypothetical protein
MLLCAASLPVRGEGEAAGAFLLAFAAWDVFYYLWLYVSIGWPAGVTDWDILFLIPLPWVGPVWSVLLICAGMLAFAAVFLRAPEDAPFAPGPSGWTTGVLGAAVVIATYILEWKKIGYGRGIPSAFSLAPFLWESPADRVSGSVPQAQGLPGSSFRGASPDTPFIYSSKGIGEGEPVDWFPGYRLRRRRRVLAAFVETSDPLSRLPADRACRRLRRLGPSLPPENPGGRRPGGHGR